MNANRWIQNYTIVDAESAAALEGKIEGYIRDMWQPYGPVIVSHDRWYQAMVYYA